jgi:uncharacterized iron-regulated protein
MKILPLIRVYNARIDVKIKRFPLPLLIALLLLGCISSPVPHSFSKFQQSPYRDLKTLEEGKILHVPTGKEMSQDELIDYLESIRIIYVGEAHTNLLHHQVQLDIIKNLAKRFPGKITIGVEMFGRPSQPVLNQWSRGEMDERDFAKVFYESWNQDYEYYKDIFVYSRDHGIPLIALNISDELIHAIQAQGTEGLSEEFRKVLPEIDTADPYHRQTLQAIYKGHIHGNQDFDSFYKTMLLWDETMAKSITDFLSSPEGHGNKMVVLAGGGHVSYGYGIPRRVFRRLPEPYAIVLPYTSRIPTGKEYLIMDVTVPELPLYIADFVWAVGYEDLENKGVRLGIGIERSERGVLVRTVKQGSSASKGGIQTGDVVTTFGGEPVMEPFELIYLVKQKKAGDKTLLHVLRGDELLELEIVFNETRSD